MNDHVAKSIDPENLWKALLKWIKPQHSTTAVIGVEAGSFKTNINSGTTRLSSVVRHGCRIYYIKEGEYINTPYPLRGGRGKKMTLNYRWGSTLTTG